MKAADLEDPELYRLYLEQNLRVLTMRPLVNANLNDLDSLEVIHELARLYRRIQNNWLYLMGHTPGREQ